MVRHMFPGGNTPNGFYSYFDNILPISDSQKTICLKGGSGTGKSTFMKKIGKVFENEGFDVEYMHCSNDSYSIDGVYIPQKKISVVDATAPHTQDPILPVAVDKIINLAEFIDEVQITKEAKRLKDLYFSKKKYFDIAYGYFNSAYSIYLNNTYINNSALDRSKLNKLILFTIDKLFKNVENRSTLGRNRKLFISAITPDGYKNYIDQTLNCKYVYGLYGYDGMGIDFFLLKILEHANMLGLYTESYYSPLNPQNLEHLLIPELDCCFTICNSYHSTSLPLFEKIDFFEFCDMNFINSQKEEIKYNTDMFNNLLDKTMKTIKNSKVVHNQIEEIYIANMNFKKLDEAYEDTIKYLRLI